MAHDHMHEREVIVEDRSSGIGTILGAVVVIALLIGIWYFALGPGQGTFGGGTTEQPNINVDINAPEQPAGS